MSKKENAINNKNEKKHKRTVEFTFSENRRDSSEREQESHEMRNIRYEIEKRLGELWTFYK